MSTGERVRIERREGLGIITLNRPEALNVLGTGTLLELESSLRELEQEQDVRAIIITGGKTFSAGADIREMREMGPSEAEAFSRLGHRICSHIEGMAKPVLAAIDGYALGGGCELALCCDMRIATENAKFGQPEVSIGLIPGFGATQRLPRLVGYGKASEMFLTGKIITAREAEAIGLAGKVVGSNELMAEAEALARTMAEKSREGIRLVKQLLRERGTIADGLEREIAAFAQCFVLPDRQEGMDAFLQKRRPKFT